MMSISRVSIAACGPLLLGVATITQGATDWVNMTVYHTNQANYSAEDIADMNTADVLGDLEFTIRAKIIPVECSSPERAKAAPWDCENPEQDASNLAVTKLIISVKQQAIAQYCPCNVHEGIYTCKSRNGTECGAVGAITVMDFLGHVYDPSRFTKSTPSYEWYAMNTLRRYGTTGMWYSTLGSAQCAPGMDTTISGVPCSWRVVEVVKRVARTCSDAVQIAAVSSASSGCFDRCPQPTNQSSPCWVDCYFSTLLGPDSAHNISLPSAGMPITTIVAAWDAPFNSVDKSKGGCPSI
eukprot:m.88609 g.88609  ORF g.88609 m.88609 type:complete len:296 (+) comp11658_c0_seq1:82-969(+)